MAQPEPIGVHPPAPRPRAAGPVPVRGASVLVIIGIFKLIKGLMMFLLGLIALHLVHKNLSALIERWADYLHLDPNGKWITWLLIHAFFLSPHKLMELGIGLFFYSGLFLTEGVGLVLRKHWAEYFTTICTGLFIPLEFYEIGHRIHDHQRIAVAIYLTIINVAIVIFLIARLRREAVRRRLGGSGGPNG